MAIVHIPANYLYALSVVGLLYLSKYLLILINGIVVHFLRPGKNLVKTYGKWAVVTGATDGIGKAMAFELAKKGCSLLLISRTLEKLKECKNEINAKYPKVEIEVLAIDYSKFDTNDMKAVSEFIKDKEVGVLINNVGMSYPYTRFFHELDDESVQQLMTMNVHSTTWMTRIVLPNMLARKHGAIVNLGSAAGVSNSPLLAEYGAAKSYITQFSKILDTEYKAKGIDVQCQVPSLVATKLAKIKHASLFVPSPAAYARAAVACIGYESVISPYWSHAFQIWFLMNLPEWLVSKLIMSMHLGIRAKGMKKDGLTKEKNN